LGEGAWPQVFPMKQRKYGGSQTTASTESPGIDAMTSTQSPSSIWVVNGWFLWAIVYGLSEEIDFV
jgi:hypothetical protein